MQGAIFRKLNLLLCKGFTSQQWLRSSVDQGVILKTHQKTVEACENFPSGGLP